MAKKHTTVKTPMSQESAQEEYYEPRQHYDDSCLWDVNGKQDDTSLVNVPLTNYHVSDKPTVPLQPS